ncbi:MAG: glycoside hydrolase family 10 protein [Cyanobacteria bacterium P01_H01_bin.15]
MNQWQWRSRFFLCVLLSLWLCLAVGPIGARNRISELRGVWLTNVDSPVLFDATRTRNALDALSDLNFNTVYPTVWNWGHTLYPSQVAQAVTGLALDPEPGLQNRDVLAEICDRAREKNLSVIPWFEFGFMAPAYSELAKRHPEWLTQRADGSTVWLEGGQHERVWLNPIMPQVQDFLTALLVEIVERYDIDGIQVDDHFGYPSDFGYDSFTVDLYQAEHNGQAPPEDPKDDAWIDWRAAKISDYVVNLRQTLKSLDPTLVVSVSPNPQPFSRESYLLDWATWLERGLIDELVIQVYRDSQERFEYELSDTSAMAAQKKIPVSIGILTGLKNQTVPSKRIRKQVKIAREQNYAGVSFFFYESLWTLADESKSQRQDVFRQLFTHPVPRPELVKD